MVVISNKKAAESVKKILKEGNNLSLFKLISALGKKINCRRGFAYKIVMLLLKRKNIWIRPNLTLKWRGR